MNQTRTWKKIVSILLAVVLFLSVTPVSTYMDIISNAAAPTTLYLTPNSNWKSSSAWFAAYFYNNSTNKNTWVKMTDSNGDGIYECSVPSGYPNVVFCRMNSATSSMNWNSGTVWNQTSDLTIPTDGKNHYTIAAGAWSKGSGSWGTYTPPSYYVAGDATLCGEAWNTTADKMTMNSDGTYSITFTNVGAGTHKFKVVKNGNWDNGSWPSSDYSLTLDTTSNVTITFNPTNNNIGVTKVAVATNYSVIFDLTNITKTAGAATASSGVNYGATLAAVSGYQLPDTITVKAGSAALTSGTDYTYDRTTGAITIMAAAITGNITITAKGIATGIETDGNKVYLKTGVWNSDTPRFVAYFYDNSSNNVWVTMTDSNGDGVYECDIPEGYPNVIFCRLSASTSDNIWTNVWNKTNDLVLPTDGNNCYEITGWGSNNSKICPGTWTTYTPGSSSGGLTHIDEITLNPDEVFYVDTDLVDYLNDHRVINKQVAGYFNGNQGIWNNSGDSPFSYFNYLVGMQVSHGNYTYPLYFGSLNYIGCRYGKVISGAISALGNWYSSANVALTNGANINADAVVQGLVHNQLVNGNLADPVTQENLLYFDKVAAEDWTNEGYKVMNYYEGLRFPFKVEYDPATRVTTYSYDSAKDYAVYYDYANPQLYASSTKVLDSEDDDNKNADDYGFYPLNKPGDSGNALNHGFGAKFNINFTVGEDGKLSNGEDVTFHFTGDDDVWVFIDGVLILDMGGAHSMASGSINFASLTSTVNDACSVEGTLCLGTAASNNLSSYQGKDGSWLFNKNSEERANVTTGTVTKTFEEMGLDFDYGTTHTMTVFYMERAGVESNFSMEFTMVPVPSGMTLSKELNEKEINSGLLDAIGNAADYEFAFAATSPNDTSVSFDSFILTHKRTGEVISVNVAGNTSNGVFSAALKGITDLSYAHSFVNAYGEDAFIPGTQFTITEKTNGIFSYSGTTWTVYDAKNSYAPTNYSGTGMNASFTMGNEGDNKSYSYAVVFKNNMNLGNLQISKIFEDDRLADTKFQFNVYLDLDGKGTTFKEGLYTNLVYTIDGESVTSTDGSVYLKGGQTALISGIPAGATYRVVEVVPSDAAWLLDDATGTEGEIKTGKTESATFVNVVKKHGLQGKMIFVEAGTATNYVLTQNGQTVTITGIANVSTGLTAVNNGTSISVTGAQPNMVYTMECSGRLPNGEIVYGFINVYTYSATNKTYVFDFGLKANLADTTYGDGLFQNGWFVNDSYTGTTATLISLTPNAGNSQTTVSTTLNGTIGANGSYSAVTFSPAGFMSKVETYTYTVRISVNGVKFDPSNPETGTIVTGTFKVMPANAVYYEDNFNAGATKDPNNKIIFSANAPGSAPTLNQSNDQTGNYGYDPIYNGGYAHSAGSSTTLVNGQYGYFTFYGTGFDLISRTNGATAGFAVYVFSGAHSQDKLNFMNSFSGPVPADMVFVDTYYNNGDLFQVPVVSVRLDTYGQYTVYVQALATSPSLTTVSVDGIRIYNPLADTSAYPNAVEKDVTIDELRDLYGIKHIVSLAGIGSNGVFRGMGKADVVEDALANASIVEDMNGNRIDSVGDLESICFHGPNNEMYLPKNFGIGFTYKVTDKDWTLQLGAKAVTASDTAKSITIYARANGTGDYKNVGTIQLNTATDMYYDLTAMLSDIASRNNTFDIIIISDSEFSNNEFVSLTTVKYSGIELV